MTEKSNQTSSAAITEEEAILKWAEVKEFVRNNNRNPDINSEDPYERHLADDCKLHLA